MTAAAIAQLIAGLLPTLISAYETLAKTDSNIPPLATLLATADGNWANVIAAAKAEAETTTTTTVTTTK
jgi:hypothetical protein